MKIRSKLLYQYLLESGVLNGTPEAIGLAKREYRKRYKKQWKGQQRLKKEIRFEITLNQFQKLKLKARAYDLRHTTYTKQIVLASIEQSPVIPYREVLEKVLQLISMATTASINEGTTRVKEQTALLLQAETYLLNYLQRL